MACELHLNFQKRFCRSVLTQEDVPDIHTVVWSVADHGDGGQHPAWNPGPEEMQDRNLASAPLPSLHFCFSSIERAAARLTRTSEWASTAHPEGGL